MNTEIEEQPTLAVAHLYHSWITGLVLTLVTRESAAVAAEFGTHDPVRVFGAMRADNWLHRYGDLDSEQGLAIKRELLEVFRPADPGWEARILEVGAGLIERARDGLAEA